MALRVVKLCGVKVARNMCGCTILGWARRRYVMIGWYQLYYQRHAMLGNVVWCIFIPGYVRLDHGMPCRVRLGCVMLV